MLTQRLDGEVVTPYEFSRDDGTVAWMDGGGSNVKRLGQQLPGSIRLIFTFDPESSAQERSDELKLPPPVVFDIKEFEADRGVNPGDYFSALHDQSKIATFLKPKILQVRADACAYAFEQVFKRMDELGIPRTTPIQALGGETILDSKVFEYANIWNVHPGDLTKYAIESLARTSKLLPGGGWRPSAKAFSAGHEKLYSSLHQMTAVLDGGPVFIRGYDLPIDYNVLLRMMPDLMENPEKRQAVAEAAQDVLKYLGDHVVVGATLDDLFKGNWGTTKDGVLAYRQRAGWYAAPNGILIQDHVENNPDSVFKRDQGFIDEKVQGFYAKVDKISGGK